MPAKPKADANLVQSCRVCGGEVNASGACVVCGTKQTAPAQKRAVLSNRPSEAAPETSDPSPNGFGSWLAGPTGGSAEANAEALRKWLAGEEGAFQEWLGGSKPTAPKSSAGPSSDRVPDDKLQDLRARALEVEGLRAELDAMRSTLTRELGNFRSGPFDPVKYIEETASLSRQLHTEIARRKELEQEIEHIKKGTIAVIKYVKAQQLKAGPSGEVKRKLDQEVSARKKLEADLAQHEELVGQLRKQLDAAIARMKPDERALRKREVELAEREASLKAREAAVARAEAGDVEAAADEQLTRRFEEELRAKEQEYLGREEELKKRLIALEEAVNEYKIELQLREQSSALSGKSKGEIQDALSKKEKELLAKEKSVLLREEEIKRLQEELRLKDDEMRKVKEPLQYKEEEILRREEDLMYREKLLEAEQRKLEEAKALGGSTDEVELKKRLEELKGQIQQKEEEVRTKERYLAQKMEELRLREQGIIEEDIQAREQERQIEFKQDKVKTGISRLDDLMFGGIPFGSNVSVYGPAYVGKEVVTNLFMAEGLKKGLPVIWVLTDKGPADIRDEMSAVLPGYEEYEKLGLVRYVDAYSKSMGGDTEEANTTYVDEPTDHQSILKAVDSLAKDLRKKHSSYRLGFRSVSTLIAYLDPTTTFKFLQPFVGRRKRDKAVTYYVIEKGMHEDQEIQMLGSLMDGALEFKVEQLKSFMSVKGICDVQSRGWIRYTYTKSSVSIGSFSLDHIK
jgi:KaiC/GvpD/RAD55 family RecA-like ATPase